MGLCRDIDALDPRMRDKVILLLDLLEEKKIEYAIIETRRSEDVQKAYFAQGRETLAEVNKKRKNAGLWEITEAQNRKKITWTLKSKHLDGLAIDIGLRKGDAILWSAPFSEWEKIGELGELVGLKWGGRWETRDCPHFQLPEA